ncbi:hypothetical protein [Actinomadura opuntiae]|uniref:hypothetical protein n=1 Tax=Actinomadura sp. OS1-43 TaxID=604315 RepID=UPI00255AF0DE|nr:hypothetical protein [Actinomadura sp. OS1-43]MDL4820532.1 hypothetical protein [Actinomadura sp. OS1-43]
MPESRDLPPAGYTRATPRPPLRTRLLGTRALRGRPWFRSPLSAVALAAVLAVGIAGTVGYGISREAPARTLKPDAASPSAPPVRVPAPATPGGGALPGAPAAPPVTGPSDVPTDDSSPAPAPTDAEASPRQGSAPSGPVAPQRTPGTGPAPAGQAHAGPAVTRPPHPRPRPRPRPRPAPRPHVPHKPRTARPAAPSWIGPECRRRFPGDPARQAACVSALTRYYGR